MTTLAEAQATLAAYKDARDHVRDRGITVSFEDKSYTKADLGELERLIDKYQRVVNGLQIEALGGDPHLSVAKWAGRV